MKTNNVNDKLEKSFDIFKEIFQIVKLASKHYKNLCKKYNITQTQFQVLYLLNISDNNGIKMSVLGDNMEIERSGVTLLVDKMALEGLVIRRQM